MGVQGASNKQTGPGLHRPLAVFAFAMSFMLATCSTLPKPEPAPGPAPEPAPRPEPVPEPALQVTPDANGIIWQKADFTELPHWRGKDARPALQAFVASCAHFSKTGLPDLGFATPCEQAQNLKTGAEEPSAQLAQRFFTDNFTLYHITLMDAQSGLLTAYYEPEVSVRRARSEGFSEPIMARPEDLVTVQVKRFDSSLPDKKIMGRVVEGKLEPYFTRTQIRKNPKHVLAWGRPADVFFLQVQGSGRMRFSDGQTARAAFAGHNGRQYRSIGRLLIARGELQAGKASKQGIENWMQAAGAEQALALMNENPRYVFFSEHDLRDPSLGPKGTQGVPLIAGASLAVDSRYYPFGLPVWMETRLPKTAKDWQGSETGILAIAQDSGGAIKGPLRADLFMGSGAAAGQLAGIQHHQASWWVLLPNEMAKAREQGS